MNREVIIPPLRRIQGVLVPPADKSILHRAILLNALAGGEAVITAREYGADNVNMIAIAQALGARAAVDGDSIRMTGAGMRPARPPAGILDCGNSGTAMRLLAGVLAGQGFGSILDGDESLRRRPMARVTDPLARMGARIESRQGRAPLTIHGTPLRGARCEMAAPSAQVKSAVMFAGLYAEGETQVVEIAPTRDHTERLFHYFGLPVSAEGYTITTRRVDGWPACGVRVAGDISAASFFIAAAALARDGSLRVEDCGLNPTRTGFLEILSAMGGDFEAAKPGVSAGEPVGTITVRSSRLEGVNIGGEWVVRGIDELPIAAILAAAADGETSIRGASELRVKESDRITLIAANLRALGVPVVEREDGVDITGIGEWNGGEVDSGGDHRIAMAFAAAACRARGPIRIRNAGWVETSWPGFFTTLGRLSGENL
ncbi:MAG: 3-phosphoshikimate 1-carboxyvinyltransferase [Myxococcota bacterium]|nr:3-phosphoshikimate 1-carboxyvinyltransferase [Myxococcota bacterium]